MHLVIAYYVYIHFTYIMYIYIHNWGNVYITHLQILITLQIHVQTFNYINCISNVILSYIHIFPTFCHHSVYTPTHCEQY